MSKHPKPEKHKQKPNQHHEETGKKELVSNMGTTPSQQSPRHPRLPRDNSDYSPTPGEMMRRLALWLRGFHWSREKAKVTDWLVVGLTLAVAVAAFWSAWIFQRQLQEARKQTRLSVRPWIGLDEGLAAIQATPLQIGADNTASAVYKIQAKNYGTTPASNVWANATLVVADDLNTAYEEQRLACGDALIGKPDIGLVLFPGRDRAFSSMPSATKVSIKHPPNSAVWAWLAGCIGYRDQFNYLCRTKFLWQFRTDDGNGLGLPIRRGTISGHFVASASGEGFDSCQVPKYQ